MDARLRRVATAATIGAATLVALPATVAADCNGPACGVVDPPVEGIQAIVFVAILLVSGSVMAAAELRRR